MNSELIKKLNDVGFPFKKYGNVFLNKEHFPFPIEPTLSELIEAIGTDEYFQLTWMNGTKRWQAHYKFSLNMGEKTTDGSTPDEAVANLYIALHEAQHSHS